MKSIKGTNNRIIEFSNRFTRQLTAAPNEVKAAFRDILVLFAADPSHESLRNHPLQGKLAGYRSIDVTGDWRAIFREKEAGEGIVFYFYKIGTHRQLYK
jgi:addiction module RelE/StbE family toxin